MRRAVVKVTGTPIATAQGLWYPESVAATAEWRWFRLSAKHTPVWGTDDVQRTSARVGGVLQDWQFVPSLRAALLSAHVVRVELYRPSGSLWVRTWARLDRADLQRALQDGGDVFFETAPGPDGSLFSVLS